MPSLLNEKSDALIADAANQGGDLVWDGDAITWQGQRVARLVPSRKILEPQVKLEPALSGLGQDRRESIAKALQEWLDGAISHRLKPLVRIAKASEESEGGPELRALLIALLESGGALERKASGLERFDPEQRNRLRRLGVQVGALDIFVPAMARSSKLADWKVLDTLIAGRGRAAPGELTAVLDAKGAAPLFYRRVGQQIVRVDLAERLLHTAHQRRAKWGGAPRRRKGKGKASDPVTPRFALDPSLALSMGLSTRSFAELLRQGGFSAAQPEPLGEGHFGPPEPPLWRWRPLRAAPRRETRKDARPQSAPAKGNPFAGLAELIR